MNVFLESLTIILWVLFGLSVGLAVWALVRRAAKMLLVAALPAGVFAFFFFWDPHGRLFFIFGSYSGLRFFVAIISSGLACGFLGAS